MRKYSKDDPGVFLKLSLLVGRPKKKKKCKIAVVKEKRYYYGITFIF